MSAATLRLVEPSQGSLDASRESHLRWVDEILEEAFRAIAGLPGATPDEAVRWLERAEMARSRRLRSDQHHSAKPLAVALACVAKGYAEACAVPGLEDGELGELRRRRTRAQNQALRAADLD